MNIKTGIAASAITYGLTLSTAFGQTSAPFDVEKESKNNFKGTQAVVCSAAAKIMLDTNFAGNKGDAVMVVTRALAQGTKAYGDVDVYTLKAMSYKAFIGQGLAELQVTNPSEYYDNLSKLKQLQNLCVNQLDSLVAPEPRK